MVLAELARERTRAIAPFQDVHAREGRRANTGGCRPFFPGQDDEIGVATGGFVQRRSHLARVRRGYRCFAKQIQ